MDQASKEIGLVIPAHNEGHRLPATLRRLDAFAAREGLDLQLVVVDDGSTDGTRDIAQQLAAQLGPWTSLQTVSMRQRGKGAAVRAGFGSLDAEVVGYCDADLSAGPDAILKVLAAIHAGADVAMGSRGLPASDLVVRQIFLREWAGKIFNLAVRWATRLPYRDTQCGLKLLRRKAAHQVFPLLRLEGFAFDTEVIVVADRLGLSVEEVPISWSHATGSKVSMIRDPYRMARDLLRVVRRLKHHPPERPGILTVDAALRMIEAEQTHWWHVAKRELVTSFLRSAPPGRCLDVGCGGGALVAQLSSDRPAVGVDVSRLALEAAAARGEGIFLQAEAGALPFSDGSFSAVLSLDALEHHPDPRSMLQEMYRVLDPGGMILVTVPAFSWMWSYSDHLLGHYRRYTRRQLLEDLRSSRLEVVTATYFHSWLLPIAWIFRRLKSLAGRGHTADDFRLRPRLNETLLRVARAERRLLRAMPLPFGLSILAVASKRPTA